MKTKHFISKLFPVLFLSLLFLATSMEVQAQLGLPGKIKRKVDQKVDRKVDEVVDDALDDLFKKKTKKEIEENTDAEVNEDGEIVIDQDGEKVTISMEEDDDDTNTVIEPAKVTGSFTMEVSEYKKGKIKKDFPMALTYHIDTYRFATKIDVNNNDAEEMITIYDRQSRKTTMKMIKDGEKTAMVTKMPRMTVGVSKKAIEEGNYEITKTGRTKTIEGYSCEEYKIDTEDELTYAWMSKEALFDLSIMGDLVRVKNGNGGMSDYTNVYQIEGLMLEAHTEIKGKDENRDVFLKNLKVGKVDQDVFSTDGYNVTDMTNLFKN
ncbi:MAG: DUF4412 domain-containing protein [Bacteroidetes bacterium]|nr:DUF4412 domain-containing protein [Bacteroidota bacterium]